jgi:type II secretory pathway pseudopilin PulG
MKYLLGKKVRSEKQRAFTMIELIAGVLAVAILGSATAVVAQAVIERSRDQVAVSRLTSLARMVQVKYTQAQGTQTWEQVLISAAEEVRFTQGSSGLNAAAGVIPQTFLDTCNFDGTGCLEGQVSSLAPDQVSYKAAVVTTGEYANQSLLGLALKSESGNCVMLRGNVNAILDAWSTGRDMAGDCRGAIALGGPSAEASVAPTSVAEIGIPSQVTGLAADGTGINEVVLTWTASTSTDVTQYKIVRSGGEAIDPIMVNASTVCTTTGCSYSDTSAKNGESYSYQVLPVDNSGYTGRAATVAVVTVPAGPTDLTATGGISKITLNWTAGENSLITGYNIYINGATSPSVTAAGTASSVVLRDGEDGLTINNGDTYSIVIKAYNTGGESTEASASATPLDVPAAPVIASCQVSNGAATLNWNTVAPTQSAPISGYRVYVNGSYLPFGKTTATATSTVIGLTNGQEYAFQVASYGTGGEGSASAAYNCTPVAPPLAPSNLRITSITGTTVKVDWDSEATVAAPVDQYLLFVDDVKIAEVGQNQLSYTVTGLTAGEDREFKVRGKNNGPVLGTFSDALTITAYNLPAVPQNVTVTQSDEGELTVDWNTVSSTTSTPVTGYRIYRNGSAIPTTTGASQKAFGSLDLGSTHSFQIAAYNASGQGTLSDAVSNVAIGEPVAPTLTFSGRGSGSVDFEITIPSSDERPVSTVVLQRCTEAGTNCQTHNDTIALSDTEVTATGNGGSTYTFRLLSTNILNTKTASSVQTIYDSATAPSNVTVTQSDEGELTINWDAVNDSATGEITNYQVFLNDSAILGGTTSGTSKVFTGLTLGTEYELAVAARTILGTGASSANIAKTAIGAPAAVTMGGALYGDGEITYTVSIPSSTARPVDDIVLKRCAADGSSCTNHVTDLTTSSTTAKVTGVGGTTYTYKLQSTNVVGQAEATDVITVFNVARAPENVTVTREDEKLILSWDAVTDTGAGSVTDYQIKLSSNNGAFSTLLGGTSTGTSKEYTVAASQLTLGSDYSFMVAARSAAGTGLFSTATEDKRAIGKPTAPTITRKATSAYGDGTVAFDITVPTNDGRPVSTVVLQRCTASGTSCEDHVTNLTTASTAVTGSGTGGTTYTYKLLSTNSVGENSANVVETVYNVAPAPTNVQVTQSGQNEITVTWNAVNNSAAGTVNDYQLRLSENGGAMSTLLGGTSTGTSKVYTGLTNGSTYSFQVAARTIAGTGVFSAATSATTSVSTPPTPVVSNSFTYGNMFSDGTVSITKSNGRPVTSVEFFRCATDGTSCTSMGTKTLAQGTDDGTTVTWSFRITATSAGTYRTYTVATNSLGTTASSTPSTGQTVTVYNTPSAPITVTVTRTSGTLTVNWTAGGNANDTIGYRVYVNGSSIPSKTTSFGTNTASFTSADGFTSGTSYTFSVAAYGNAGESTGTSGGGGQTFASVPSPATVTSVNGGANNYTISVNWNQGAANGSAISSQLVRCWATSRGASVPTDGTYYDLTPSASATSGTVTSIGFSSGTTFYCAVRQSNAVGDSSWSNVSSGGTMQGTYSAYSYGAYSYGAYSYGAYGYGAYSYSAYSYSAYGYGAYSYGAYSYGAYSYSAYSYGAYGYGAYSYGAYGYGAYGAYGYGAYGYGAYGAYGYGAYGYGAYGYGAYGAGYASRGNQYYIY